jgi:hypothetical protein
MSTPQTYIDALKNENVTWPTQYNDMFPYSDKKDNYFTGFYSSRPSTKKFVKDNSATYHSLTYMLAQRVVNQKTTDQGVTDAINSNQALAEELSRVQQHNSITGTDRQYVDMDFRYRIAKAMSSGNAEYKKELANTMLR